MARTSGGARTGVRELSSSYVYKLEVSSRPPFFFSFESSNRSSLTLLSKHQDSTFVTYVGSMMESKDSGFSTIVVELIAGLPPESSTMIKYIVSLATSLVKPALATHSHVVPEPYCPYS
jgi:hypothetical protein